MVDRARCLNKGGALTLDVRLWRCSQLIDATLYLIQQDGVCCYASRISSRIYVGRENGDVGSVAAGGVVELDWPGVRQGIVVYLLPVVAARWDPAGSAAALAAGAVVDRARDDIAWSCGRSIGAFDGQAAGPRAVSEAASETLSSSQRGPFVRRLTVG